MELFFVVFGNNFVLVGYLVFVLFLESIRVVNINGINVFDFEVSVFVVVNKLVERGRGIGVGEDVFVYEKILDEIFKLLVFMEISNL